jgi:deoxyribose-phosphate aldolase
MAQGDRVIPIDQLVTFIDHTLLKPEAVPFDIERVCEEARTYRFHSVCVNPVFAALAASRLQGAPVKVCCVAGFPLGAHTPAAKAFEARQAVEAGAGEIDMVINIGALKAREDRLVHEDVQAVVQACHAQGAICKVILETALLTDEEKVRGCQVCVEAGADFVKTSTGFGPGGATVADVALLSRAVASRGLGVKAAGGIRSYADLVRMVEAGATRVGSSGSLKIVEEARALGAR